ncbi:TPM domain-containing protein [uncultured Croceitalea sp.]|uniref:TPM domain-containing protein n=1 Tax=uncultured Croceitalea sp. TaxID=1798908 RepID=UPI0033063082
MSSLNKQLFLLIVFFAISGAAQKKYPELTEIVTDHARIFNQNQLTQLREKLTHFESESSNQLAVLTIPELGNETIETYANGTFNQNGLGQEGTDNGILILFSSLDREVRVEVGYGLEPYITDAVASRIIRNTMIPNFKEQRYFEGINIATDELILYLNNPEALDELKAEISAKNQKNKNIGLIFMIGFFSLFAGVGGFLFYKTYRSLIEIFRGMFIGKLSFVYGLFMIPFTVLYVLIGLVFIVVPVFVLLSFYDFDFSRYVYLLEKPNQLFWLLAPILGIAMLIALLKILLYGKEDLKISWIKSNIGYVRKTFSSSGSHSFSSGSGSSGSSGFSGGGGSSGGGGASGSW